MYCAFYCSCTGMNSRCTVFKFDIFDSQNYLYSFEITAPPLSAFIFSGSPYKFKFSFRKFKTSLVSADLQSFAVGLSLYLSTAIRSWFLRLVFPCLVFRNNQFEFLVPAPLLFLVFRIRVSIFGFLNSY